MRVEPNYIMDAWVTEVRDGDTVEATVSPAFKWDMREVPLRLKDINTPELNSKDEAVRQKAQEARQFAISQVLGKKVIVQTFKTKGGNYVKTFDRYVAVVYYDDALGNQLCLNDELVKAGHAMRVQ